jgi:hypothetical protein
LQLLYGKLLLTVGFEIDLRRYNAVINVLPLYLLANQSDVVGRCSLIR